MGLTPEQIDAINKASDTSETIEKQLIEEGAVDDLVKQVKDITQGTSQNPVTPSFAASSSCRAPPPECSSRQ